MSRDATTGSPIGVALALGSASAYGTNIVFSRLLADAGVSGVALVFYRTALMLAAFALIAAVARHGLRLPREHHRVMAVLVVSSVLIGVCYISSIAFVPVTVAVVVFYTYPVVIVLASPFVEGRRLGLPILAVAAVAFTGVACVIGPAFEELDWRGVALAGAASLAAATQFFAGARAGRLTLTVKLFWINLFSLPVTLAIALAFDVMAPPGDLLVEPLVTALFAATFAAAIVMQFLALARTNAVATGLSFCIEPVVAAIGAALILGERLAALQIAGVALVICAIAGNVLLESRRGSVAPPEPGRA